MPLYPTFLKLSSVPFFSVPRGIFSSWYPPPSSPSQCWVCLSPYPCLCSYPYPSSLQLNAGENWLQSGQRSCPVSLVPGKMWRWGRTEEELRRSGRRMAHRGPAEGREEGRIIKSWTWCHMPLLTGQVAVFIFSSVCPDLTFQMWIKIWFCKVGDL